jgi:hypothetical protein
MRAERDILTYLAGEIAQARFLRKRPRWGHGASSDNDTAVDMAFHLFESKETIEAYLKYCCQRAKDLVDCSWSEIERLAQALVEKRTLDYEEALEVIAPGSKTLREAFAPAGRMPSAYHPCAGTHITPA